MEDQANTITEGQVHQAIRNEKLLMEGIVFPTPRWAYVKNQGMCQIISYHGNGYWIVLNGRDQKLFKRREDLSFRKAAS